MIVGCDKTIPAGAMALARMDLPGLVLYSGTIAPGRYKGEDITIQDVFEAVGAHAAGTISDADLEGHRGGRMPGPGACGGQFTANTMSTALEFLGISPGGANGVPAMDERKDHVGVDAGELAVSWTLGRNVATPVDHHAKRDRERHRVARVNLQLDQRRAAPNGDGP